MSKNMNKKSDIGRVPYGLAVHDEEEEKAVLEVIRNHETIKGVRVKEFEKLMVQILALSQQDIQEMESFTKRSGKGEEPCIKPSDMI